ncbi:MAG: acyl-CoA dehydratase activase [Clostridiales bacterium]|nr:acyl-CoA dehydratase activase [Clostridiales bacterium]
MRTGRLHVGRENTERREPSNMEWDTEEKEYRLGIDVGSTTVKLAVTDPDTREMLYSRYERHYAKQLETVLRLLEEAEEQYPDIRFRAAVCGSGGKPVAQALQLPYIQEVVANAAAVCELYPKARTAIELGGQDAKIIFFYYDEKKKRLQTSDMRMNGSCAGGTGAFIDEIATLLDAEAEGFEQLAAKGTHVFDISGRCGVFAKTDIQPLLIQGAAREDIALSSFHAIAKQTIGGLSQGLELKAPIIFEGGPLTFHPTLIRVFAERLNLRKEEIIVPEHPETIVARGTSYAVDQLFPEKEGEQDGALLEEYVARLVSYKKNHKTDVAQAGKPFFESAEARERFEKRHEAELKDVETVEEPGITEQNNAVPRETEEERIVGGIKAVVEQNNIVPRKTVRAYLGIDSGSTTSKMVLMDEKERVIGHFYANNQGNALGVVQKGILKFYEDFRQKGITLDIIGLGTTGYGEKMLAKAFRADYHVVETVAHARSCLKYYPDTTFLLDIGGQDMKAIWLDDGIITNIMLNEACSSGCGSFLENFAGSLGIAVEEAAEAAFRSKTPAVLGSRCTVFMNSTIINEQRNGKDPEDIMAGLCRSIIENVFTKVVRVSNVDELGDHIVVQGGTFRNQAVLRALEEYLGKNVTLAPYPGEMGALGAAILAKEHIEENGYKDAETSFIGENAVRTFACHTQTGVRCPHCANHCSRTVMTFSTGEHWITGNRCERGEVLEGDSLEKNPGKNYLEKNECREKSVEGKGSFEKNPSEKCSEKKVFKKKDTEDTNRGIDLFAKREQMLFRKYDYQAAKKRNQTIGLPRVLEFWDSMPFWSTFFRALGYDGVL